jgi:hypothetical protein|tara:strand:- start:13699 stop:14724 length:1026 start_codon:yes stop_codon:yes gene_type:complete
MSKGGSGSGVNETTSTVTQSNLPEYAEPYITRLMQRAETESLAPYTTYEGQRLATFTPEQELAMTGKAGLAVAGDPAQFGIASDVTGNLAQNQIQGPDGQLRTAIGSGQNLALQRFNQQTSVDASGAPVYGNINSYMNPYQQQVIDMAQNVAREQSLRDSNLIAQDAAFSGGLGGYREGIMQSEREGNLNKQISDIQLAGSAANYEQAQSAYNTDRAARLGAIGIDQQTRQQQLAAANQLGNLGFAGQTAEIQRMDQLGQAGTARQAMQQQLYDTGYQEFQDQLAYPRQNIAFYQQALRGMPIQPGQQVSTYAPTPSAASSMLGMGLGGLGLYQAMGGMGA